MTTPVDHSTTDRSLITLGDDRDKAATSHGADRPIDCGWARTPQQGARASVIASVHCGGGGVPRVRPHVPRRQSVTCRPAHAFRARRCGIQACRAGDDQTFHRGFVKNCGRDWTSGDIKGVVVND